MSSLLHPIHGIQQSCRPKHQVLVLKCYPKYQKNVQEVKASSSELSYLLYYASSRKSKLQKVGAFLEKKTASDVWRNKLGNVQVTLQILLAIIEKTPRDLSLYSNSVLTILNTVLLSKDINMVEESIATFEAYCKYVTASSLTADQNRAQQYLAIVELYAKYADRTQSDKTRARESIPMSIRWRNAGLRAIRAAVGSDALGAESAKQLNIAMPVILENISLEKKDLLGSLQQRAQNGEKQDHDAARRRRMSSATVTTIDSISADPVTATETTADADKAAEDEVKVLAIRCLKQIFSVGIGSTRGQTRLATALTLKFIATKNPPRTQAGNWATSLFETIARWTPVQDRFIIMVTAMETLVRSPIIEAVLEKQLVLATMIDWLLSSSVNLIGLSVMDVLLGFVHHTLLLLQLGGKDSKILPHQQQSDTLGIYQEAKETFDPSELLDQPDRGRDPTSTENSPSLIRQELLFRLQNCVAALSNHIYYTDQITDMLTAILARLKPSAQSDVTSAAAAINNPAAATKAIAESASLQEDPSTDSFFSFATAREVALKSIKDVLIKANNRRNATGSSIESRSRVGIQVWEGTQWLLKDEDPSVRSAYVDAILIWLKTETNKSDMLLPSDGTKRAKQIKKGTGQNGEANVAKRAVSNASRKESRANRSTFLQLLHLAIYDRAIEFAEDESEILTLYLLLSKLVERLGVNALRSGLPMALNLQEEILNGGTAVSSVAKVNVASLVHGYLWTIAEKFDFEASKVGHEINAEISRRKRFSVWFEKIKFPAVPLDSINGSAKSNEKFATYSEEGIGTLKPFFNLNDLVDEVANAYDESLVTPPTSAPSSPGRVFSVPTLGFGYGYSVAPGLKPSREDQLPQKVKDEMMNSWSRESCIAAVEKESSGSVAGSRTGASSGRKHLQVNGMQNHGSVSGRESPNIGAPETTPGYGLASAFGSLQRRSKGTGADSLIALTPTSSRDSTMRVTDLKRALSGYADSFRHPSPLRRPMTATRRSTQSSGSESMVSWNEADDQETSRLEKPRPQTAPSAAANSTISSLRPSTSFSKDNRIASGGSNTYHDLATNPRYGDDDVPPVPKIPSTLNLPGTYPRDGSPPRGEQSGGAPARVVDGEGISNDTTRVANEPKHITSRSSDAPSMKRTSRPASRATMASTWTDRRTGAEEKLNIGSLLAGIRSTSGATLNDKEGIVPGGSLRLSKPPY